MIKDMQRMPHGIFPLFTIQMFSTFAFAVLYSSLSLYITKQLGLSSTLSNSIVGVFLAFNYVLHLLGGVLGGSFLSNRVLFFISILFQSLGIFLLALVDSTMLYTGLSLFLVGCGLNVTCFNNMLSQRFNINDPRREQAFFFSYAAMNIGFCGGFFISGFYDYSDQYQNLFYLSIVFNLFTLVIMGAYWNDFKDRDTPLAKISNRSNLLVKYAVGFIITLMLIPVLMMCFNSASFSNYLVVAVSVLMFFVILILGIRQKTQIDKQKMMAYLVLAVTSIVFWMIYFTGPMGVTLFIKNNVDKHMFHYELATQWLSNINAFVIIFGAPLMAVLFNKLKNNGYSVSVTMQFVSAFVFLSLSFFFLVIGIKLADSHGYSSISWTILHFITQAIAELLIGPVGYAMIGRIAPSGLQGLLMGTWMMVSGVSAALSHFFSNAMVRTESVNPFITNNDYEQVFIQLGEWAIIGAVGLYIISSKIKPFIDESKEVLQTEELTLHTA